MARYAVIAVSLDDKKHLVKARVQMVRDMDLDAIGASNVFSAADLAKLIKDGHKIIGLFDYKQNKGRIGDPFEIVTGKDGSETVAPATKSPAKTLAEFPTF